MQTTERNYSKGDIIFREGEPSSSAFMIVKGQVGLFKKKLVGSKFKMIPKILKSESQTKLYNFPMARPVNPSRE